MTIQDRKTIDTMIQISLILDKTRDIIAALGNIRINIKEVKLTLGLKDVTISGEGDK